MLGSNIFDLTPSLRKAEKKGREEHTMHLTMHSKNIMFLLLQLFAFGGVASFSGGGALCGPFLQVKWATQSPTCRLFISIHRPRGSGCQRHDDFVKHQGRFAASLLAATIGDSEAMELTRLVLSKTPADREDVVALVRAAAKKGRIVSESEWEMLMASSEWLRSMAPEMPSSIETEYLSPSWDPSLADRRGASLDLEAIFRNWKLLLGTQAKFPPAWPNDSSYVPMLSPSTV